MPGFKSEAQREKFKQFVKDGKVSQKEFDRLDKETPKSIPDRLHKKKGK
jgi:hypothetical protein